MLPGEFWYSKRFSVAILVFVGQICDVFLASNLNLTLIEMTSGKTTWENNRTSIHEPEFNWSSQTKGLIIGAYSIGGIFAPLGGYLALKFGGSTIIGFAGLISSLLAFANPTAARQNFYFYMIVRAVDGICHGFRYVSVSELWSQWAPIEDRSKLIAIGCNGVYAGSALVYPLCGFLVHKFGWPMAFYFTGTVTLLWSLVWLCFVSNDPATHRWISKEEVDYIKRNQNVTRPKNTLSLWTNMMKSKPVLAFCFVKMAYRAGFTIVVTCLPLYIKDITNAEIHHIGVLASIPNIIAMLMIPFTGYSMDILQNKQILTATQVHKIFLSTAFLCCSFALIVMANFPANFSISIACSIVIKVMLSSSFIAIQSVVVCLAPQCASLVAGFSSLFFNLSAFLSPVVIGFVVISHSSSEWSTCFYITSVVTLMGAILFLIFGSSEPQSWSHAVPK